MSGLGPSFMKIWTRGSSPRSWSWNAWKRIKNVNGASRLSKVWIFFSERSKRFPVTIGDHGQNLIISLWPGDKATMNGVVAWRLTPPRKNSECKNPLEISGLDFLGSRRHTSNWLSSKGSNYQRGALLISAGANEGHFEGKRRGKVTKGVLFLHDNARLTGHLQPRRNWPTWASSFLIIHPILRIWHRRTTTRSLDWKKNCKFAIFRPTRRSLLPRRPGWTDDILIFFWVACKS